MNTKFLEKRGVVMDMDADTELVENRGVGMDTAWNRWPPNSDLDDDVQIRVQIMYVDPPSSPFRNLYRLPFEFVFERTESKKFFRPPSVTVRRSLASQDGRPRPTTLSWDSRMIFA